MSDINELKNARKWSRAWKQAAKEYKRYWKQDKNALNHAYSTVRRLQDEKDQDVVEAIKRGDLPADGGLIQFNLSQEDIETISNALNQLVDTYMKNSARHVSLERLDIIKKIVVLREMFREDLRWDWNYD